VLMDAHKSGQGMTPDPPAPCSPPPCKVVGSGLPASPGAAVGQAVFTAEEAESWAGAGLKVRGPGTV